MADEYQKVFKGVHGSYNDYPLGDNDRILAGLSYFHWIVALISILIKPCSPFRRFHAAQALGLQIISMVFAFIVIFLSYFLIGLCLLPFLLALSVYMIVIMILVLTGKDHRVPMLADYIEENFV